jgi:hypothetical protein
MLQDGESLFELTSRSTLESDGELETDSIEHFTVALQPIEFKLHISLVIEI